MIESLVDAACDREEDVRKAISKSLVDIGRRKHVTVLKICHTYLMKHNKVSAPIMRVGGQLGVIFSSPFHFQLPRSHRTILLQLMEKISKEHIHDISEELAKDLIALGSAELTLTDVNFHEKPCTLTTLFSFPTPQCFTPFFLPLPLSLPLLPPFLLPPSSPSLPPPSLFSLPLLPLFFLHKLPTSTTGNFPRLADGCLSPAQHSGNPLCQVSLAGAAYQVQARV